MQQFQSTLQCKALAKDLFGKMFDKNDLQMLCSLKDLSICQLLSQCAQMFHKQIQEKYKRTLIFLANYHKFLNIYSVQHQAIITNDMSVHFILTLGYSMIRSSKISQAKNIFEIVWRYIDIVNCNQVLLSIALSNLCFLHLNKNSNHSNQKALQCSLKGIQLMGGALSELKKQKLYSRVIQDSVILINHFIFCRKALKRIVKTNKRSFYKQLLHRINQIGYKCSKKYLGIDSQFTKVFKIKNISDIQILPIYYEPRTERTSIETKILKELEGISEFLKTKRQPEIIYINEPKTQIQPPVQVEIVQPVPQNIIRSLISSYTVNGWQVQAQILRISATVTDQKQNKNLTNNNNNEIQQQQEQEKYTIGSVQFNYANKKKVKKNQVIPADKLQKITGLVDIKNDIAYEQQTMKNISDNQFMQIFLFPFLWIDDEGNLQLNFKKRSLIKPYEFKFLHEQCKIFFNHVQGTTYRLQFLPLDQADSLCLNIDFLQESIKQIISCQQIVPSKIKQIYRKVQALCLKNKHIQLKDLPLIQGKCNRINVVQQKLLRDKLDSITRDFEIFIVQRQQNQQLKLSDFVEEEEQTDSVYFFKEQSLQSTKGQFTCATYQDNIDSIQIFCQNNFQTYDLEGQSRAKGTASVFKEEFQKLIGLPLKFFYNQNIILMILKIYAQKFNLKTFFRPLKSSNEDIFNQNAILELPLISKSHKRQIVRDENQYLVPLTIRHLAIDDRISIGFQIEAYFPVQGLKYSVFVHVAPCYWQKHFSKNINNSVIDSVANNNMQLDQQQSQKQSKEKNIFTDCKQNYEFTNNFFLVDWLELEGYEMIMRNIKIRDMKIHLNNECSRFYRLERIIQKFKYF